MEGTPPGEGLPNVRGLPRPRLAVPRPKLQATKGTAALNPFGANKMTISKEASLMGYIQQRAATSLRWHQIEKKAGLPGSTTALATIPKAKAPSFFGKMFSDQNVGKAALGVAGAGALYGGYKGVQAGQNYLQQDRQERAQQGFNPRGVY